MKQFLGKAKDITGEKFGRLMAIKRVGSNPKNKLAKWLCKCECGKEKIVEGHYLRRGSTKSCGCLNTETVTMMNKKRALKPGLANMRELIKGYKASAKRRGIEYNLTEEQFAEITKKDCYYCGGKPKNKSDNKECNGSYVYNGIDRIDNNKGYTIGNIVPCCHICNGAKCKLTLQEFRDWIKRLILNYKE